jgi:hypothetical protein
LALVALTAAAIAAFVIASNSDELLTAFDTLSTVSVGWVGVAIAAEALSYLARGGGQDVVLGRGARRLGPLVQGAAVMAGDAAAYCLPFGFAASGVVMFGVLRRRRVSAAVAGWMFGVSSVLYLSAVAVLTIIAVRIAGDSDPIPGLESATVALLVLLTALGVGYVLLRRKGVRAWLGGPLDRLRRRRRGTMSGGSPGRVARYLGAGGRRLRGWAGQLAAVRLSWPAGVAAFALMMLSWLADVSVLAVSFVALGATPPWAGLLLAYCAGQIAGSLPVTPGGLGVVEGSLTLALVAFGGDQTITLAAVLLYRIIVYWACIPLGALSWLALRATAPAPPITPTIDRAGEPAAGTRPAWEGEPT